MELINYKSNPDFVRISKTVTFKANNLITIESRGCGILETIPCNYTDGKVVTFIEDFEIEFNRYFIGDKELKSKGVKEYYDNLFVEKFDVFERKVNCFVKSTIESKYDTDINNLPIKKRLNILNKAFELRKKRKIDGRYLIVDYYYIRRLLYMFKNHFSTNEEIVDLIKTATIHVEFENYNDRISYGLVEHNVYEAIKCLNDKIYI